MKRPIARSNVKRQKRRYTYAERRKVLESIFNGMTLYEAAEHYKIPYYTIHRWESIYSLEALKLEEELQNKLTKIKRVKIQELNDKIKRLEKEIN